MKILGSNGDNNEQMVKDYINAHEFPQPIDLPLSEPVTLQDQRKQMQVIIDKESFYFQFLEERYLPYPYNSDDYYYPNMNPNPHDWGLCQLSVSEPSLSVIWNWKTNINAGIHHLWSEKFSQLKRDGLGGGFYEIKERFHNKGIEIPNLNRKEFLIWLAQRYKGGQYYMDYTPGKKGEKGNWVINPKHRTYGDDFCVRFGFSKCE
ncbi:MAG: hypothetical protein ROY99_02160 [Ignavibacterium sp.]|jgi:hypothetical protein|nr:hypothetical protein [Ignavibacterium sp.]